MKKIIFSVCIVFLAGNSLAGCSADEGSNVVNVEEYLAQFQNNTPAPSNGNISNGNNNSNGNNGAQGNGNSNENNGNNTQSTFQQYLITTFDNNKDGVLDSNEIASIVALDVSGKELTNLDGLDKLTSLERLNASNNKLTSLELPSTLVTLVDLKINGNQLTKLDISKARILTGGPVSFDARNNPNLTCIKSTSEQVSSAKMFSSKWLKDASASFNTTCD